MNRNTLILMFCLVMPLMAQDVTVVSQSSEAADGLDLAAVGELVKEARDGQHLEALLNDPNKGINNLDLDGNEEVDYIRVVEQASGNTHVFILQVPLGEDEYQDVATIDIERDGDKYAVQLHGNEQIYGAHYYVHPPHINWGAVVFFSWLSRPRATYYVSPYRWGYYPRVWRPWRPVTVNVYRTRTLRVTHKVHYTVNRTSRVVHAKRIYSKPRSSVLVTKPLRKPTKSQKTFQARRTTTVKSGGFGKKKTTQVRAGSNGKTTVAGKRTTTTKTTTKGKKKTVTTKKTTTKGKKTTVTKTKKTKTKRKKK